MPGQLVRKLQRDRTGAIAVLIAVSIVPLIGIIGVATDTARGYYLKSRLSSAVDAAALAGGQVYFQDRRDDDVRSYFRANFPPGFMGATVPDPVITPGANNKTLTVSATATVPTTFMRLFGKDTMSVASSAEVTRETKALDVVLAIDMSSSMLKDVSGSNPSWNEKSRLELAKDAARKLVEILYGAESEVQYLRIGLVPWAGSVNVTDDGTTYGFDADGDLLPDGPGENARYDRVTAATYYNRHQLRTHEVPFETYKSPHGGSNHSYIYYAHNSPVPLLSAPVFDPSDDSSPEDAKDDNPSRIWEGCVWARWESSGPTADTKDGPTSDWPAWSPKGIDSHLIDGEVSLKIGEEEWRHGRSRDIMETYQSCPASRYVDGYYDWRNGHYECTPCPRSGITSLIRGRAAIEAAIDRLNIPDDLDQGFGTNIPQGLVWGWRVVSPGAPFVESADHPNGYEPARAIILLTDGKNDGYVGDTYNGALSETRMDDKLKDIADNIKADNDGDDKPDYDLYVIQFAEDEAGLQNLLKGVATESGPPYYFNAPDEEELDAAFQEIGNHLSNLRLSR